MPIRPSSRAERRSVEYENARGSEPKKAKKAKKSMQCPPGMDYEQLMDGIPENSKEAWLAEAWWAHRMLTLKDPADCCPEFEAVMKYARGCVLL